MHFPVGYTDVAKNKIKTTQKVAQATFFMYRSLIIIARYLTLSHSIMIEKFKTVEYRIYCTFYRHR